MFTSTTLLALLPSLLLSFTPAHANPMPNFNVARQDADVTATATIISYFVATSCDSPFSQATQTIASNECMDLGEPGTTRSIALYNLAAESEDTIPNCVVRVWETETCTGDNSKEISLAIGASEADKTCVAQPTWTDDSTTLGSAMLVCTD